jgi:hypothetical protein
MAPKNTAKKGLLLQLNIDWAGPYSPDRVIADFGDGGTRPHYEGLDYGLYQIYGDHILSGSDTLLYVGKANRQTFSRRFKQHRNWLQREGGAEHRVFLGRIYIPRRHTRSDSWSTWENDVYLAERLVIHKYSPNYNSSSIARPPELSHASITIVHRGSRGQLKKIDHAPDDL